MTAPPETRDDGLLYVAVLSPVEAEPVEREPPEDDGPRTRPPEMDDVLGPKLQEGVWEVADPWALLEVLQGAEAEAFKKAHPRWPKGTPPPHHAGQFMHVGDRFNLGGKDYEIAHILNGKIVAHLETKNPKEASTIVVDPAETGLASGLKAGAPTQAAEPHEADVFAGAKPATAHSLESSTSGGKPIHKIATVDPYVDHKSHDPSIPIPSNSPISPEEWKRFGRIDQENYARLQEKFGKYAPGAAKKHLNASYTSYDDAVQGLVKQAFQSQFGSSSGWTLSLASLFKGVSKNELQLQKLHEKREKAKRLQREVGDATQWDLYNRTRSPDVVLFHKTGQGAAWWKSNVLSGNQPAFSGLSQSFAYDSNWGFGSNVVMSPTAIRHVTMATFSAQPVPGESHFAAHIDADGKPHGELEISVADQMALKPDRTLVFAKTDLQPNHQKWLTLSTFEPHGGEMFDQFKVAYESGAMLPTPPAAPAIAMDGSESAGKGYLLDQLPDNFAELVNHVTVTPEGEALPQPMKFSELTHHAMTPEGAPQPANTLELHPGDFMMGQQGARYVIVKDTEDSTGWGFAKVELDATGKPSGKVYNFSNQGASAQYKLNGHVDLPIKKKEGLAKTFNPSEWVPAEEQKFLQAFVPGEKFKVLGNAYEVVPGTVPNGFVKIVSLDTGKFGKINGDFKTSTLVEVAKVELPTTYKLPAGVKHEPGLGPSLKFQSAAGGTTGAAWYEASDGSKWVVKHYSGNADRVATESLANSLLAEVGMPAPETVVTELDGKRVIATRQVVGDVKTGWGGNSPWTPDEEARLREQFVAHAFIANWDVVGLEYDNVIHGASASTPIDQGGSFEYRAQGAPKDYAGDAIPELDTLRNAQYNPSAAAVFGSVTDEQIKAQAASLVEHLTPEAIDKLVDSAGFQDKAMAERVREGLKGRLKVLEGMAPDAELGKELKQVGVPQPVAESLPPAKPKPVPGMVVAFGGKKATVTKILADGTVQLNLAPGTVKLQPDDPALANLHDPLAFVAEPHKTKLGAMAPGDKFHGGTGAKVKPYEVVSAVDAGLASVPQGFDPKKQALVRNVETGAVAAVSKQKAYRKLQPKPADDVAPKPPGTGYATPPAKVVAPEPEPQPELGGFQPNTSMLLDLDVGDTFMVGAGGTQWQVTSKDEHAAHWEIVSSPSLPGDLGKKGTSSLSFAPAFVKKKTPSDYVTVPVKGSELGLEDVFLNADGDQFEVTDVGGATISATNMSDAAGGFKMFPIQGTFQKIDVEATLAKQSAEMQPPEPAKAFDPPPFDPSEWEPGDAKVAAGSMSAGDYFNTFTGEPHVVLSIDKVAGTWTVKNLVNGKSNPTPNEYHSEAVWTPLSKKTVKPDGQIVPAAGGFDAAKYTPGDTKAIDDMEVGAIFQSAKGGYYQLKAKGAPSGATATNLLTGKPYPAIKYDKTFQVLEQKAEKLIAHGDLQAGDPTLVGHLKSGDQFKTPGSPLVWQVVNPSPGDDHEGMVAAVGPNGALGESSGTVFSQPVVFHAHAGTGEDKLPMGDPIDVTTLPDAVAEGLQPYKSSHGPGGAYKHHKVAEMAPGTVFTDKSGQTWKVKQNSGPFAVVTDGVANFKVDPKVRGKALEGKQAEGFTDTSPALGTGADWPQAAVQQNLVPGGGIQLADLKEGDYFSSEQGGKVWKVEGVNQSGTSFDGHIKASQVETGDQGLFDPGHAPAMVAQKGTPSSVGEDFKGPEVAASEVQMPPMGTKIEYASPVHGMPPLTGQVVGESSAGEMIVLQDNGFGVHHFVSLDGSWAYEGATPDKLDDLGEFPDHSDPSAFVTADQIGEGEFFQKPYQEGTYTVKAAYEDYAVVADVESGEESYVYPDDMVVPALGSPAVEGRPKSKTAHELEAGETFEHGGAFWKLDEAHVQGEPIWAELVKQGGQFTDGLGWKVGSSKQLDESTLVKPAGHAGFGGEKQLLPEDFTGGQHTMLADIPVGSFVHFAEDPYHDADDPSLVFKVEDIATGAITLRNQASGETEVQDPSVEVTGWMHGEAGEKLLKGEPPPPDPGGFYGTQNIAATELEPGDEFWLSSTGAKAEVTSVGPDAIEVVNTETGAPWSLDPVFSVWSHKKPADSGKIEGSELKTKDQFEWGGDAWTVFSESAAEGTGNFTAKNQATGELGTFSKNASFPLLQKTSEIEDVPEAPDPPDQHEPSPFEGGAAIPGDAIAPAPFSPNDLTATGLHQKVSQMPNGAVWEGKKGGFFQKVGETSITNKNGQPQKAWVIKDLQTGKEKNTVAFALAGQHYDTFALKDVALDADGAATAMPLDALPGGVKDLDVPAEGLTVFRTEHAHEAYKGKTVWGDGLYFGTDEQATTDLQLDPHSEFVAEGDPALTHTWKIAPGTKILELDTDKLWGDSVKAFSGESLKAKALAAGYDGVHVIAEDYNLGGDQIVLYNPEKAVKVDVAAPDLPAADVPTPPDLSPFNGHYSAGGKVAPENLHVGDHFVVGATPTNVWKVTKIDDGAVKEIQLAWQSPDSNAVVSLGGKIPKEGPVGQGEDLLVQTVTPNATAPKYLPSKGEKILFTPSEGTGETLTGKVMGQSFLASGNPYWHVDGDDGVGWVVVHDEVLGPAPAVSTFEVHYDEPAYGTNVMPAHDLDSALAFAKNFEGTVVENHPDGSTTVHPPPEPPQAATGPEVGPAVEFEDAMKPASELKDGDLFQMAVGGATFRKVGAGEFDGEIAVQNLGTGEVLADVPGAFEVFGQKKGTPSGEALPTVASYKAEDYYPVGGSGPLSELAPGTYFQTQDGKVLKLLKHDENDGFVDAINVETGETVTPYGGDTVKEMDHSPNAASAFGPSSTGTPTPLDFGAEDKALVQELFDTAPGGPKENGAAHFDAQNNIGMHLGLADDAGWQGAIQDYAADAAAHFGLDDPSAPDSNPFSPGAANAPTPTSDAASSSELKLGTLKPGQEFTLQPPGAENASVFKVLSVDSQSGDVKYTTVLSGGATGGSNATGSVSGEMSVFAKPKAKMPSSENPFLQPGQLMAFSSSYGSGGKYKHEPVGTLTPGTKFTDKSKQEFTFLGSADEGLHALYEDVNGTQFYAKADAKVKVLGGAKPKSGTTPEATLTQLQKAEKMYGSLDQIPEAGKNIVGFASSHGSGGKYKHHPVGTLPAGQAFTAKGGGTYSVVGNHKDATIVYGTLNGDQAPSYWKLPGTLKVKTHGVSSFSEDFHPVPKPPKQSSAGTPKGKTLQGKSITVSEAIDHWTPWTQKVTGPEIDAIDSYQESGYHEINDWLRDGGDPSKPNNVSYLSNQVKAIDSALKKATFHKDSVVYRGVSDLQEVFGVSDPKQLIGGEFEEPGFASTSVRQAYAEGWGQIVMEIHVPKGAHGGYLRPFDMDNSEEDEVLLPRGSKFRITDASTKKVGAYGTMRTTLRLELIP